MNGSTIKFININDIINLQNKTPNTFIQKNEKTTQFKTPTNKIDFINRNSQSSKKHIIFNKTPSQSNLTNLYPQKNGNKTPKSVIGDRFVPNRSKSHPELGFHHNIVNRQHCDNESMNTLNESKNDNNVSDMFNKMYLGESFNENSRILNFSSMDQSKNESMRNGDPFNSSQNASLHKLLIKSDNAREIPSAPEKILDAPDLINDNNLNLLDWGSKNLLAIALGSNVYLWNPTNGETTHLINISEIEIGAYVSSLAWTQNGRILAVGNSFSKIQLWDVTKQKMIRSFYGDVIKSDIEPGTSSSTVMDQNRISSLAWNESLLSTGSRTGRVLHHDVKVKRHIVGQSKFHKCEVCDLKWDRYGSQLATASHDGLGLWDKTQLSTRTNSTNTESTKSLSWSPFDRNLLATGSDKIIQFWQTRSTKSIKNLAVTGMVIGLSWSYRHKEFIAGIGNATEIWGYPNLNKLNSMKGHKNRVLFLGFSPCGSNLATVGADETIMIWKYTSTQPISISKSDDIDLSSFDTIR